MTKKQAQADISPALQRLIDSNIVTYENGEVSWRKGHLEHLGWVRDSNPAIAERDYADDLEVLRQYPIAENYI